MSFPQRKALSLRSDEKLSHLKEAQSKVTAPPHQKLAEVASWTPPWGDDSNMIDWERVHWMS